MANKIDIRGTASLLRCGAKREWSIRMGQGGKKPVFRNLLNKGPILVLCEAEAVGKSHPVDDEMFCDGRRERFGAGL